MNKSRITALVVAVACSVATVGAGHAGEAQTDVSTITGYGEGSSLSITLDSPVTSSEASEVRESLNERLETDQEAQNSSGNPSKGKPAALAPDPGPKYRVIKCSTGNTIIKDRNGRFDVRYNCRHNNVNWGYRVSPKLVAIATSKMKESGVSWYKGSRKIGQNAPHNVPVSYFLHGTQGGISNGDTLSWYDTMVFRVKTGGKTGTARLNVGGTFVVVR